jgi:hypothetical protein
MTNVHLYMLIDCYFTLTLAAYVLCYNEVLNVCYSQYKNINIVHSVSITFCISSVCTIIETTLYCNISPFSAPRFVKQMPTI